MKRKVIFSPWAMFNSNPGYTPQDIRRIYNFPTQYEGKGQTIGILEFSNGYSLQDAHQFWRANGITSPNVKFVSVDGTRNDRGSSSQDEEASLDLQWAGALAPKANIVIYEANGGQTYHDFAQSLIRTLRFILNDTAHHPSVLSISYGDAESSFHNSDLKQIARLINRLDEKGVTVCVASGDQGAYGLHSLSGSRVRRVDAPASSPRAIAVGGTHLNRNGTESAWTYHGPQNGGATGGGFSKVFARQDWQQIAVSPMRAVPDVAFNADPATGYQIVFQGKLAVVGGTSVACPVFAALIALANEARAGNGLSPLARLGNVLYQSAGALPYRDVVAGNNSFNGVVGYAAKPGWDACTGFGSLDAARFIFRLAKLNP